MKRKQIQEELSNLKYGYDNSSFLTDEQKRFKEVELTYIGSAKANNYKKVLEYGMTYSRPGLDGETLYTYEGYLIFSGEKMFDIYCSEEWFDLYDVEFEIAYKEGVEYVMSFGRELEWLQYNPNWITQFGTVANRAGFDWNAEIDPTIVYVYTFKYNVKEKGGLAYMMEEF